MMTSIDVLSLRYKRGFADLRLFNEGPPIRVVLGRTNTASHANPAETPSGLTHSPLLLRNLIALNLSQKSNAVFDP